MYRFNNLDIYIENSKIPLSVQYVVDRNHPMRLFHSHSFSELVIVLEGSAVHIVENCKQKISTGDVLIVSPNLVHAYDDIDNFKIVNIIFEHKKMPIPLLDGMQFNFFQRLFMYIKQNLDPQLNATPIEKLKGKNFEKLKEKIKVLSLELEKKESGYIFYTISIFMDICLSLARLEGNRNIKEIEDVDLGNTIQYIHDNFQTSLNIDFLAKKSKMSSRNFYRKFKIQTGMTPINYLIMLRLEYVETLLSLTDKSIIEIAMEAGFADSSYLSTCFKKQYGISPQEFRNKNKKY